MAEEWDVFQMLPGDDAPVLLATLYEAQQKTIRVELNGCGAGSFAINRTSPECTEAILAQGNLVKVRIPEIHTGYIFAFFLETGDFTLISSQEGGGEMLTFGGRGILSYLEYARAWSVSYIDGGMDPIAGLWNAFAAGTGAAPGQILRRLIEEFQDPERPQFPVPLLTIDFDYDDDSTADPWDVTDATDEFKYQVGEDGLAITTRLWETDAIVIQMGPDFLLSAYNVDNYGRDLSGDDFGTDIVRFERGVNIATELRRELAVTEVVTDMLVSGEADKYATARLSDAAARVTKEGFVAAFGVTTTALAGIGQAELQDRLKKSDAIQFPIANRRTVVDLGDPVTVGAVMDHPGPATEGYYLPGPEGTNGDFWLGDTVRVHTGVGAFDYTEANARVVAITITREDDNHELIVIPELAGLVIGEGCVPPTSHVFDGPDAGMTVFMYEISGIQAFEPIDSGGVASPLGETNSIAIDSLTPGDGIKAIIIAGAAFHRDGTAGPGGTPPAGFTMDDNLMTDPGANNGPEMIYAHRDIASTSGSYGGTFSRAASGYGSGEWSHAAVFRAFPGLTPAIVQTKQGVLSGFGSTVTVTLDTPPLEGSVLVAIIGTRNSSADPDEQVTWAVTDGWNGLAQNGKIRMMWYVECAAAP